MKYLLKGAGAEARRNRCPRASAVAPRSNTSWGGSSRGGHPCDVLREGESLVPGADVAGAARRDNVPVETGDRRLWRLYVRDVLRPEKTPARPSRRALVSDTALAIALTVAAVVAAGLFPGGDQFLDAQ